MVVLRHLAFVAVAAADAVAEVAVVSVATQLLFSPASAKGLKICFGVAVVAVADDDDLNDAVVVVVDGVELVGRWRRQQPLLVPHPGQGSLVWRREFAFSSLAYCRREKNHKKKIFFSKFFFFYLKKKVS